MGNSASSEEVVGTVRALAAVTRSGVTVRNRRVAAAIRIQSAVRKRYAEQQAIALRHRAKVMALQEKHRRDWTAAMAHASKLQTLKERQERRRIYDPAAARIQRIARGWIVRTHHKRQKKSALVIQRNFRLRKVMLRERWKIRVAVRIQKTCRGWLGRRSAKLVAKIQNFENVEPVMRARLDEFSEQTVRRVQWSRLPDKLLLDTCLQQARFLLMGSKRWDDSIRRRFQRLSIRDRILATQFRSILAVTARENLLASHTSSAKRIQSCFRGYRVRQQLNRRLAAADTQSSNDHLLSPHRSHGDQRAQLDLSDDRQHSRSDSALDLLEQHDSIDSDDGNLQSDAMRDVTMKHPVDSVSISGPNDTGELSMSHKESFGTRRGAHAAAPTYEREDQNSLTHSGIHTSDEPTMAQYHGHDLHASPPLMSPQKPRMSSPVAQAAFRIQRFMRGATAARKHRRTKPRKTLPPRMEWDSSTRASVPPLQHLGSRAVVQERSSSKNTKSNVSPVRGGHGGKVLGKKVSPLGRRSKHHADGVGPLHQRKDSALERIGHRAADWTLKVGFGDGPRVGDSTSDFVANNLMYTSSKESHAAAADAAHEILAMQILHNLKLAQPKAVLGSRTGEARDGLGSSESRNADSADPYSALRPPGKGSSEKERPRSNNSDTSMGNRVFNSGSTSDVDSDDAARNSGTRSSNSMIESATPQQRTQLHVKVYPSEQHLLAQRRSPLGASKNAASRTRQRSSKSLSSGYPAAGALALTHTTPQERAKQRLRARKQRDRLYKEQQAAAEQERRELRQKRRRQVRKSKVAATSKPARDGQHVRQRSLATPAPPTKEEKKQLRWLSRAGERVEQVYTMLQNDRVEEIVADWVVEASTAAGTVRTSPPKIGAVFANKDARAARSDVKRRSITLLRDRVPENFRNLRAKLRAALAGLRERDYDELSAVAADSRAGHARRGSRSHALTIEDNNWQNRLVFCLRHKLLLSDALLPAVELQRILRAVVEASRQDVDPSNDRRASVLRAPTRSNDPQEQTHEWALLLRIVDPYKVIDDVAKVAVDVGPAARRLRLWRDATASGDRITDSNDFSEHDQTSAMEDEALTLQKIREKRLAAERAAGLSLQQQQRQAAADEIAAAAARKAAKQEALWRQQADNEAADAAAERQAAELEARLEAGESPVRQLTAGDHQGVPLRPVHDTTTWADIEKELYGDIDRQKKEAEEKLKAELEAARVEAEAKAEAARIVKEAEAERRRILAEARAEAERIATEDKERLREEERAAAVEAYKRQMEEQALAATQRAAEEAAASARAEKLAAERALAEKEAAEAEARKQKEAAAEAAVAAREALARERAAFEAEKIVRATQRNEAAKLVQRFVRAGKAREKARKSPLYAALVQHRHHRQVTAATKMQAVLRGSVARRKSAALAERAAIEQQERERRRAEAEDYKRQMSAKAEARAREALAAETAAAALSKRQHAMNLLGFSLAGAINADAKRRATLNVENTNATEAATFGASGGGPLPANSRWSSTYDSNSGYYYYTNSASGEVTWERPDVSPWIQDSSSSESQMLAKPPDSSTSADGTDMPVEAQNFSSVDGARPVSNTQQPEQQVSVSDEHPREEFVKPTQHECGPVKEGTVGQGQESEPGNAHTELERQGGDSQATVAAMPDANMNRREAINEHSGKHTLQPEAHKQTVQSEAHETNVFAGIHHAEPDDPLDEVTIADIEFGAPMESEDAAIASLAAAAAQLRALRNPTDIVDGLLSFDAMIERAADVGVLGPSHRSIIEAKAAARSLRIVARVKSMHHAPVDEDGDNTGDEDDEDDEDGSSDSFDDLAAELGSDDEADDAL